MATTIPEEGWPESFVALYQAQSEFDFSQPERVAHIQLADPAIDQAFRSWFHDFRVLLVTIPPDGTLSETPYQRTERVNAILEHAGLTEHRLGVALHMQVRQTVFIAVTQVCEDLIRLAEYAATLEKDNHRLRHLIRLRQKFHI